MSKYLKLFDTHSEYNAYTADTANFILPNVSFCIDTVNEVHYNPFVTCEETSVYEIVDTPSYPSEIEGDVTSFDITVNYKRTDTNTACTETVTEGSDSVTIECGQNSSTSASRTVSGTVDYHGNEIEYSVTQSKFEAKVIVKVNATSTTTPTKILCSESYVSATTYFSKIEIDGVEQPSVTTGYTFSTTGEHLVKYTLKNTTSVNARVFGWCYDITSVIIPNGVVYLYEQSFVGCSGLTSVTIPDSVKLIDGHAFNNCKSLTSIDIPDSVTSIGTHAFRNCSSLTSITIPDSVITIGESAFYNCSGATSLTIGSGVTSIGNEAFSSCYNLSSVTIGNGVTSIGNYAFYQCSGLTSITCNPTTAPTITSSTFRDVKTGGTLTVPSGSSGYDVWMGTGNYYLGKYNWTKVEQ